VFNARAGSINTIHTLREPKYWMSMLTTTKRQIKTLKLITVP